MHSQACVLYHSADVIISSLCLLALKPHSHNILASMDQQEPSSWSVDACLNGFMPFMQITFSYGPKPSEDFLQYYGFVDTDNKHDAYKADLLSYVSQHFKVEPERLQAVQKDATWRQALQQVPCCTSFMMTDLDP